MTPTPEHDRTEPVGAHASPRPAASLDAHPADVPASWSRALLALVLVLQLVTWSRQAGYSEADAVELVSSAQAWVEGVDLGARSVGPTLRPFAYSVLFTPLFWVARILGLEDLRPIFAMARCVQIGLALALVAATVRLGTQLGGRRVGLAAGFLLGANPVFLHYSVLPVTGIAAGLLGVLGLERVLARDGFRAGLAGGLWFAGAVLIAYQGLMVALIVGVLLCARHRWAGRATLGGFALGLAAFVPAGAALDRIVYGSWGASLVPYLAMNFGYIVVRFMVDVGLRDVGTRVYDWMTQFHGGEFDATAPIEPVAQMQSRYWYVHNLARVLVAPVTALGVVAVVGLTLRTHRRTGLVLLAAAGAALGALARDVLPAPFLVIVPVAALAFVWVRALAVRPAPDWKAALLLLALGLALLVMSTKGNKLYRLWLPLLPLAAVLAAWGFGLVAGRSRARGALGLLLVAAALPFGLAALEGLPFKKYAAYWRAVDWVNATVGAEPDRGKAFQPRLASAYQWAVYLRTSPRVGHARLPFLLDSWDRMTEAQRALQVNALDSIDWLVVHEPVLKMHPRLLAVVNEKMAVRAAFFDPAEQADLGPVFVLARKTGEGRTFYEQSPGAAFAVDSPLASAATPLYFRRRESVRRMEAATLLAVEYEALPGDGFGWLTWHWRADSEFQENYRVLARITGPGGVHLWHNPHDPAYGVWPTTAWTQGMIVKESFLVAPRAQAAGQLAETGLDYDVSALPGELWVSLNVQPDKVRTTARLEVFRPGERQSVRTQLAPGTYESADGLRFSRDGMIRVGELTLPLRP